MTTTSASTAPQATTAPQPLSKEERRNMLLMGGSSLAQAFHYALPGNLRTNFIHYLGITPEMQAPYSIPYTFVIGPLATILVTPLIDRVRNRIRCFTLLRLLSTLNIWLTPLIICWGPKSFRTPTFLLTFEMITGWFLGFLSTAKMGMDGAVHARIMHNNVRGRYTSAVGMINGLAGFAIGLIVTWLAKTFSVINALVVGSLISMVAMLIMTALTPALRELPDLQEEATQTVKAPKRSFVGEFKKIFKMREFLVMMPANFLRGLGSGVTQYTFLIALKRLELPPEYAGYATLIGTSSGFIGNWVLWLTLDRFGAALVIPASCTIMAVSMMGTMLTESKIMYLVYSLCYSVMLPVESSAIPLAHYEVVPREVMGSFSTVRLGLLNITTSVSSTLGALLLAYFSPVTIFAVSAAIRFMAGMLFCIGIISLKRYHARLKAQAEALSQARG